MLRIQGDVKNRVSGGRAPTTGSPGTSAAEFCGLSVPAALASPAGLTHTSLKKNPAGQSGTNEK